MSSPSLSFKAPPKHSGRADSATVVRLLDLPDTVPSGQVERILEAACFYVDLAPREELVAQGNEVEWVYLLLEGRIQQARWDAQPDGSGNGAYSAGAGAQRVSLRYTLQKGAKLGMYDLLYRQSHSVRARALEPARLVAIEADAINRLIYRFPEARSALAPLHRISRLRTIPLLAELNLNTLSYVADACREITVEKDKVIYSAGAPAGQIYLIDRGQVWLQREQADDLWLGNGMAFGFLDRPRSARSRTAAETAVAAASTKLFAIEYDALVGISAMQPDAVGTAQQQQCIETIQRLRVFREFSDEECNRLLGYMSFYLIAGHRHLLMQQGEIGNSMWVLMPNSNATVVALNTHGHEIARSRVQGPTYFNEATLRAQHYLDSTVDAESDSQWLRLHRQDFFVFLRETDPQLASKLTMNVDVEEYLIQEERSRYEWLQDDELLILFRRRHWIVLIRKTFWPLVISVVLIGLWLLLERTVEMRPLWQTVLWSIAGVGIGGYWLWGIIDYLNDFLLITNNRVVRQEKIAFIAELRQSAALRQVQNVDVTTSLVGKLLNYGQVVIQTAGMGGAITFDRVFNPDEVRDLIFDEREKNRMQYKASGKMVIQNILEERLGLTLQMPERVRDGSDDDGGRKTHLTWFQFLREFFVERHLHWSEGNLVVWRKHWIVLLLKIGAPLTLFLGSAVLSVLLLGPFALLEGATAAPALLLGVVAILSTLGGGFWTLWVYLDWRNDSYRIEGNQVIDVEKKPFFFSEDRRTALLEDIENVELRIPTPLHYLLNYGDVELQTAATDGNLTFDSVPQPRTVVEEVRRRIDNYHLQQELDRARRRAEELPDWFELYNRLDPDRPLAEEDER